MIIPFRVHELQTIIYSRLQRSIIGHSCVVVSNITWKRPIQLETRFNLEHYHKLGKLCNYCQFLWIYLLVNYFSGEYCSSLLESVVLSRWVYMASWGDLCSLNFGHSKTAIAVHLCDRVLKFGRPYIRQSVNHPGHESNCIVCCIILDDTLVVKTSHRYSRK